MGSVYCPESDTTYIDLDAWHAAEKGSTFKTAEITGTVDFTYGELRDDDFTGGAHITASSGNEFNPAEVHGSPARINGVIRFVSRDNTISLYVTNVSLEGVILFVTSSDNTFPYLNNCLLRKDSTTDTIDFLTYQTITAPAPIENCVFDGGGSSNVIDGIYHTTSIPYIIAINCIAVEVPRFGFIRGNFTNCIVLNSGTSGTGVDFFESDSASDYNASSDNTASGTNSLTFRTTDDLVDYTSGDWRTALNSPLATSGNGINANYIGVGIESTPVVNEYLFDGDCTVNISPVGGINYSENYSFFSNSSCTVNPISSYDYTETFISGFTTPLSIFIQGSGSYFENYLTSGNTTVSVGVAGVISQNNSFELLGSSSISISAYSALNNEESYEMLASVKCQISSNSGLYYFEGYSHGGGYSLHLTPSSNSLYIENYRIFGEVKAFSTSSSSIGYSESYRVNNTTTISVTSDIELSGDYIFTGDVVINVVRNTTTTYKVYNPNPIYKGVCVDVDYKITELLPEYNTTIVEVRM